MIAGRLVLIAAVATAAGCKRDDGSDKRGTRHDPAFVRAEVERTAPCRAQRCRPIPDALYGVRLGMTRAAIERILGALADDRRCAGLFEAKIEVGGEPGICAVELRNDELIGIECALDASRTADHHKAIGWGLYQTLASQYGHAGELTDELMNSGQLDARWAKESRTLALHLVLEKSASIIRLAISRDGSSCLKLRPQARPELLTVKSPPPEEVYAVSRMAAKAREYLRDLTGPLEGEP